MKYKLLLSLLIMLLPTLAIAQGVGELEPWLENDFSPKLVAELNGNSQNIASLGNITGSDVDISAGTGDFTTTGTITLTADNVKFGIGALGAADAYIIWDGAGDDLDIFSSGEVKLLSTGAAIIFDSAQHVKLDAGNGSYQFNRAGSTMAEFYASATYDQLALGVRSSTCGNQFNLTHYDNTQKEHGHAAGTHPTFYVHSATDPESFATEWGSLAFIGEGAGDGVFLIDSGTSML